MPRNKTVSRGFAQCGRFLRVFRALPWLGDRPTSAERLAWEAREPGNCQALRAHVAAFPEGVYHDDAANMISARQVTQDTVWTPSERRLALFVGQAETASKTEADARTEALGRGAAPAERQCRNFTATTLFRFTSAEPEAQVWNCEAMGGGIACGFEGLAVCQLEERRIQEEETCGG